MMSASSRQYETGMSQRRRARRQTRRPRSSRRLRGELTALLCSASWAPISKARNERHAADRRRAAQARCHVAALLAIGVDANSRADGSGPRRSSPCVAGTPRSPRCCSLQANVDQADGNRTRRWSSPLLKRRPPRLVQLLSSTAPTAPSPRPPARQRSSPRCAATADVAAWLVRQPGRRSTTSRSSRPSARSRGRGGADIHADCTPRCCTPAPTSTPTMRPRRSPSRSSRYPTP